MALINTTISGINSYSGGGYHINSGTLDITNSTISDNHDDGVLPLQTTGIINGPNFPGLLRLQNTIVDDFILADNVLGNNIIGKPDRCDINLSPLI